MAHVGQQVAGQHLPLPPRLLLHQHLLRLHAFSEQEIAEQDACDIGHEGYITRPC